MYNVFCDGTLIYSTSYPTDELQAVNPKLERADNSAGSFTITLPPTNVGYSLVNRLTSRISIEKDDIEIWAGRVITDEEDFWKCRKIVCEGELAYLSDSLQPPAEYHNLTVSGFIQKLLDIHNSRVEDQKRFYLGTVTVTDSNNSLYRYTNYETTLECILDKLVDRLGGHLRVRMVNGKRYLDYLKNYPRKCKQPIVFGENLLNFTKSLDMTDLATVIIPTGDRLQESPIEALDAYLTVASVNKGSIYVESTEAVKNFGRIEKRVQWPDVTTPEALLKKAQNYLKDYQWNNVALEVTAIDLSNLNPQIEAIDLLDQVECISLPHGLDRWFPVSKVTTPLDAPDEQTFLLGSNVNLTLASVNRSTTQQLSEKLEEAPTMMEILQNAKENATELINSATEGVITIKQGDDGPEEFIIANNKDYQKATKVWRWNINGFGYSNNGYRGPFGLAMTMDGAIVADYITAGVLNAARIKAGILSDVKGRNYWNLETGEFSLQAGTTVGGKTVAKIAKDAADKAVDDQTQLDIFNTLTNNGKTQGIYLKNGLLYLNASYMQGGTLVLGGSNNSNGQMVVRDSSGKQIGSWNNTGLTASGAITLSGSGNNMVGEAKVAPDHFYSFDVNPKGRDGMSLNLTSTGTSGSFDGDTGTIKISPNYDEYGSSVIYSNRKLEIQSQFRSGNVTRLIISSGVIYPTYGSLTSNSFGIGISLNAVTNQIYAPYIESGIRIETKKIVTPGYYVNEDGVPVGAGNIDIDLVSPGYMLKVTGSFSATGTKSRLVTTKDYSDRLLYCYETPSPMFGDLGDGTLDENGECIIEIDDIFSEATRTDMRYQVFLQKCGPGDIWVEERTRSYFVVKGTPGLSFSWELKGKQTGYEFERLEMHDPQPVEMPDVDIESLYASELEELINEQEVLLSETA